MREYRRSCTFPCLETAYHLKDDCKMREYRRSCTRGSRSTDWRRKLNERKRDSGKLKKKRTQEWMNMLFELMLIWAFVLLAMGLACAFLYACIVGLPDSVMPTPITMTLF